MGIRTTITAFIILLLGVGLTIGLVFDYIDKTEYAMAIGSVGTFGGVIVGLFAKDQNKSHTQIK
jgi:uncharacterized membrane protein